MYGIADYGNVIALAKDTEHVEHIWSAEAHIQLMTFVIIFVNFLLQDLS